MSPVTERDSGDDANAEVFPELLQEHEGEHRVGDQADSSGDETLRQKCGIRLLQVAFFFPNAFIVTWVHVSLHL